MMTLDTNILVYVSDDGEAAKQRVAKQVVRVLSERRQPLGLQVIGELQNALRRKLKQPPWTAAQNARNALHAFDIFPPSEAGAEEALTLMASGRLNYWDALLIASARSAGVTTMFSEDMQDGQRWGVVEIINPFTPDGGLSARARELLELAN